MAERPATDDRVNNFTNTMPPLIPSEGNQSHDITLRSDRPVRLHAGEIQILRRLTASGMFSSGRARKSPAFFLARSNPRA